MPYGTVKVDNITFDQGGADQNTTVSGIYRAITSGVTVTGTISGAILVGTTTVSGATVTGTTVQGTTVQGVSGTFTSLTGTTTTGTTANFASGVFTTIVSGLTVTGTQSSFTSGNFVTLSGATATFTSGVIASGTAATPSLSIVSDPNTGIYSPGADQLAISTGGSGRLFVDASGNVGVTNANASLGRLHVRGALNSTVLYLDDAAGDAPYRYLSFSSSGNGLTWNINAQGSSTSVGGTLTLSTNSTERLRITSTGLVGVGTSSPAATLHVGGVGIDTAHFGEGTTGAGINIKTRLTTLPTTGTTANIAWLESGSGFSAGSLYLGSRPGVGNLVLSATGAANLMIAPATGNVGIGTTSPASLFHMNAPATGGGAIFSNQGYNYATISQIISSADAVFGGGVIASDVGGEVKKITADAAHYVKMQIGEGISFHTNITGASGTSVARTTNERMRIDSSGRVGIGTTSPDAPLHVKATAGSTSSVNTGLIVNYESTGPTTSGGGTGIRFKGSSGGGGTANYDQAQIATSTTGTNNDHGLDFYTRRSAAAGLIKRFSIDDNGCIRNYAVVATPVAIFGFESSEAARIDSLGRLLVGTSSARLYTSLGYAKFQLEGTSFADSSIGLTNNQATVDGAYLVFNKTRGTAIGSVTSVQSGDLLGSIWFQGTDGTSPIRGATIEAAVDGTPGANDMPGRLVFSTTADGAASPTERMRIRENGNISVSNGATSAFKFGVIEPSGADRSIFLAGVEGVTNGLEVSYLNSGTAVLVRFNSITTTASAANAFLDSADGNRIYRSTSSLRYKEDVESIEQSRSDAVLNLRPVWYRSKAADDRKDWSWYGLIAEEVAEVEPRLVHWTYLDDSYNTETVDGEIKKTLKEDAQMVPDGVQYDRLTVLLLDVVKRQQQAIETLEAKVAALESA